MGAASYGARFIIQLTDDTLTEKKSEEQNFKARGMCVRLGVSMGECYTPLGLHHQTPKHRDLIFHICCKQILRMGCTSPHFRIQICFWRFPYSQAEARAFSTWLILVWERYLKLVGWIASWKHPSLSPGYRQQVWARCLTSRWWEVNGVNPLLGNCSLFPAGEALVYHIYLSMDRCVRSWKRGTGSSGE